ncbi:hypothetical protein K491DRAFT_711169 [Lophiostoma macrostomum CBS 122681]|uniref:Uncharacterized protein n=1 Tax=Lophiostoma macrostomum CBS 122681 TaxID=1314788 RepID=A0A6A6TMH9_9PLEO|nr:hypothetical protein K491DRAFT_711169 [Lophiostoma macrostomum CBS 122681]
MQSGAQRRALSYLASKIHPQLPLTPRESEQLLKLLTTSFRTQLDREHPVTSTRESSGQASRQLVKIAALDNASPSPVPSSYSSADQHMLSILANPLFAVKPRRRASEPGSGGLHEVLRDPLTWFLNHVASGTADLSKAAACLAILKKYDERPVSVKPAAQIAKWLQTSNLETSGEFMRFSPHRLLEPLVELLSKEGEMAYCWRWLRQNRVSTDEHVVEFQSHLVRAIVGGPSGIDSDRVNLNHAVVAFMKAKETLGDSSKASGKVLRRSGTPLLRRIMAEGRPAIEPDMYESFLESAKSWALSSWSGSLQAILRLHHPTWPTAAPSIAYLRSGNALARVSSVGDVGKTFKHYRNIERNRRYLIHLCLEAARRCLAEQNYSDAQFALEFAKNHFPELTEGAKEQSQRMALREQLDQRRQQREEDSLALLNQLLPT